MDNKQFIENHAYVSDKRKENGGVKAVTTVFGIIHFGLSLAAEAVTCAEAGIVNKMTKGEINYEQMKNYRMAETASKINNTKDKCREFQQKMKDLKARAEAKSKGEPVMEVA